jgi:tol-pal system protein YbgF
MLTLLASAANSVFAAPAPVSDLSRNSTSLTAVGAESSQSRLERLVESRNQMQLQMQLQLDQIATELQNLRGTVERNSYDIEQTIQRQRELFIEVDNLRNQVKNSASAAPALEASAASNEGIYSENVDEQAAYQSAVDLILKKRDYSGAIDAFNQFRRQFPESSFTPNAHYWLGQLYFAKKQFTEAKASFAAVVSFAESNKRPDALVKLGDIEKQNNNVSAANNYYQQVISEYPSSSSAQEAKQSLQQ